MEKVRGYVAWHPRAHIWWTERSIQSIPDGLPKWCLVMLCTMPLGTGKTGSCRQPAVSCPALGHFFAFVTGHRMHDSVLPASYLWSVAVDVTMSGAGQSGQTTPSCAPRISGDCVYTRIQIEKKQDRRETELELNNLIVQCSSKSIQMPAFVVCKVHRHTHKFKNSTRTVYKLPARWLQVQVRLLAY